MAPAYSWLALAAALATVQAQTRTSTRTSSSTYSSSSAFWTYTSRIQDSVSTTVYTGFDETYTDSYTSTRAIKTDASPTATPYSTSTSDSYYYYSYDEDVQYVYAYYSDGAVPESMLEPTYDYSAGLTSTSSDSVYTVFRMPVTYTAPASCPTPFTVSVDETVTVPTEVRDQVTPTSKKTGSVQTYFTYGATQTETWYLSAGAAPLRTSTAYNYEYYVASCSTPYSSESTSGSNYRSGGGDYVLVPTTHAREGRATLWNHLLDHDLAVGRLFHPSSKQAQSRRPEATPREVEQDRLRRSVQALVEVGFPP
jgi:hypothetical protein